MKNFLTLEEAYAAIYIFLDKQYDKKSLDELGNLLSDMATLKDNLPADIAIWIDWTIAASTVLEEVFINKIMEPVIKSWQNKGINVDIALNSKNILLILATNTSHLTNTELDQIIIQQSTTDALLNNFSKLRGYNKIIFRIPQTSTIIKNLWIIADEQRMKELTKLFHASQKEEIAS